MNIKEITILLIDNDVKDIEKFVDIFAGENVSILAAVTFKRARAILGYFVPDIIVSELDIEAENGFDFLKNLKSHVSYAEVPMMFLSKSANINLKVKALTYGAECYMTKPYVDEELRIRVKRILNKVSIRRFDIDKKIFSSAANLNIIEMLQLLDKTQKSGALTIFTDHKAGRLHFVNGNIVRAKFGSLSGRDAVYRLLETKDAIFEFEFKEEDCDPEITAPTQSVILDGLKQIDEREDDGTVQKIADAIRSKKIDIFGIGFGKGQIGHLFDEKIYNLISYPTAAKALKILENVLPDALIVNPDMKDMDGIDFLRTLEANSMTYHLPVIFVTTGKSEARKVVALKEGAAEYIVPPITKFEFDAKLKKTVQENILKKSGYEGVLRGSLKNFTVLELIQGIQGIEKTCMITFYNGDDSCILFFSDGQLINAKIQHHEGEEAVYKILMWSRGYFDIMFKDYSVPRKVKTSTFNLVLDGISKSAERDEEEVDKIISIKHPAKESAEADSLLDVGFYNFILETAQLELSQEYGICSIKTGGLNKFLSSLRAGSILIVDFNLFEKEAHDEFIAHKKLINEKINGGLKLICFTSRPEIYGAQGVINKFSWLPDYDDGKKIMESLSDQIVIQTTSEIFELNEIINKMYYTAAFPHGFGTPPYEPLLHSTDEIPVAFYKKVVDGTILLLPQTQSKEEFLSFFVEKIMPKI